MEVVSCAPGVSRDDIAGEGKPLDDGELWGLTLVRADPGFVYMLNVIGTLELSTASLSSWPRLREVDLALCAARHI